MGKRSPRHKDEYQPLHGLRVGISGAIPEREHWGAVTDLDQLILRFVSQLSALIMKYGGEVVHGSHPSLTPVILDRARAFDQHRPRPAVTLIASTLWGEQPEVITRAARRANVILTPRIGKGNAADPATRNDSLTALRLTLAASVDVLVAIGGKLHQKTGYNPGVLEELAVARWSGVPCFVVASYGGLAGMLETEAIRQFSIGNRLDDSMHGPMASWGDDVEKFVGQLVEHFIRSRTVLAQPHKVAPVSWHRLVSRGVEQFVGNARIDSGLVRRSSKRFAKLKEALDGSDIGRVRSLLRSRSSGGGDR